MKKFLKICITMLGFLSGYYMLFIPYTSIVKPDATISFMIFCSGLLMVLSSVGLLFRTVTSH